MFLNFRTQIPFTFAAVIILAGATTFAQSSFPDEVLLRPVSELPAGYVFEVSDLIIKASEAAAPMNLTQDVRDRYQARFSILVPMNRDSLMVSISREDRKISGELKLERVQLISDQRTLWLYLRTAQGGLVGFELLVPEADNQMSFDLRRMPLKHLLEMTRDQFRLIETSHPTLVRYRN